MSPTRLRRIGWPAALAGAALVGSSLLGPATSGSASAASVGTPSTLRVGTLTLHQCVLGGRPAYCGRLSVPLDYADRDGARIAVHFGWLPAADPRRPRPTTIVAQEGGPGYPSTGTASDYVAMLRPLLDTRNLLLMDERGTGGSAVVDCRPLQTLGNLTSTPAFHRAVTACGHQLDHTYRLPAGGAVAASDLFSTANGVRDLKTLLTALQTGPVDLYGDSYGTYFGQSFLSHFPGLLRSLTLDSTYEARDLDPWYLTSVAKARAAFDAVCRRAPACHEAAPGSSWARISRFARLIRQDPVSGMTTGLDDKPVHVVVDETALVNLVNDAGYDFGPYRALDAAIRAYSGGDKEPILRLWAQDIGWDDSDYVAPAGYYSDGQYVAVACTDYPQLFGMRASQPTRREQLARSIRKLPAQTFAPFTTREWLAMQPYTETYTGCLTWPAPTHPEDPPVRKGPIDRGHVPVLVLNGSLDSLTPAAGGAHVARQIGPDARAVVVPNMVHLVGLDDRYGCGASLVQRFMAAPLRLHSMDVSCKDDVPEVHAIGRYPETVADALPATGQAPLAMRRLAAVVTAEAGDAATRYGYVDGLHDRGLRGGTVDYQRLGHGLFTAALHAVRWTTDSAVSGTLTFSRSGLAAHGRLSVQAHGRRTTALVRWATDGPNSRATVHIGDHVMTLPAP